VSFETDALVDRRKLRRKLTWWRVLAIACAAIAVVGIGIAGGGGHLTRAGEPYIARIGIAGLITGDRETLQLLKDAAKSKSVAGVVLAINSPGGTVTGSEAMFDEIRKLATAKPTVAVVDGMAASGAYIAAIGTDHIVSLGSSVVGSIGVIAQYPNFTRLLDTVGVTVESVRSTPLKAQPSGLEPTSPEARAALQATVLDSYAWFKDLVKARRSLDDAQLAAVSDGRVFTGRQGLPMKLVDEIGREEQGVAWLESKGVPKGLQVRDLKRPERVLPRLPFSKALAEIAGLDGVARRLARPVAAMEASTLDGLLVLWQPAVEN